MSISSPGIGSNLDVTGIVSKLMAIESAPLTTMQNKEASYLAKITAYGTVKGALSSFQAAVTTLSSPSAFKSLSATSSDTTVMSAFASSLASPGNYAITVGNLAQSQTLASAAQASTTTAVGTGTETSISFQFGTISGGTLAGGAYSGATFTADATQATGTVVIGANNNSLQGIRDAINAAGVGVTASLVNDGTAGTPFRLMLTSTSTGAAKSLKITSSGGDADVSNLLTNDPAGTQHFNQTVEAKNAAITVNGLAISSASNAVSEAIGGVTLNLSKGGGATTTLAVANNTTSVTTAVQALVTAYNSANATIKSLIGYDATTKTGGLLLGDSSMQSIQAKLRATMSTQLTGLGTNTLNNVTQIGITFLKDGTLSLDNTKLASALSTNFSDMSALFATAGKSTDSLVSYTGSTASSKPGAYAVSLTSLATQGKAVGANKATQAALNGSIVASLTVATGTNDQLLVDVDGAGAIPVTLTAGSPFASAAALATQVETDINAALTAAGKAGRVNVTQSGGKISINSTSFGSSSGISVTNDSAYPGNTGASSLLGTPTASTISTIKAGINDQLTLSVNGTSASVTLAAGTYTATSLAAQLQAAVNGTSAFSTNGASVSISQSGDVLSIASTRYGSSSAVSVTGGTAFADLFSGSAAATAGTDIAGTINGVAGFGAGQFLTGASGDASDGVKIQIVGGMTGDRGTVNFSQGYAYNLNKLIDGVISTSGSIASNTASANSNIAALKKSAASLTLQLTATEARYRKQYTALDVLIGNMTTTSSFLTQQLASIQKNSA